MANNFHPNAYGILKDRYLLKNQQGKIIEEIDELPTRIAWGVATDLEDVAVYEELIRSGRFLPNSPCIANAGRGWDRDAVMHWLATKEGEMPYRGGQLSACFVLPVYDDLEAIFDAIKWAARIHQTAGGTGFNFSRLRHNGAIVKTSGGQASGPISFMSIFDKATGELKAGGFRRGANMGLLGVRHKDIRAFISCKDDTSKITNFNISVVADNDFMRKALDETLTAEERRYELFDYDKNEVLRDVDGNILTEDALEIFNLIKEHAWQTGEPGLIFWDTIEEGNPLRGVLPMEAVNPCGEQPLPKWGSCVLASINYAAYVLPDGSDFDWELLGKDVATGIRFLDDIVTVNHYVTPEIRDAAMRDRRVGLGGMGWAHALVKLGIPYNSQHAFDLADKLQAFIKEKSYRESERLGLVRGSFPLYEQSIYPALGYKAMRNATVNTYAPTGSISTMLQVSSGIEPMYALAYTRNVVGGDPIYVIEPLFLAALEEAGIYSEALIQQVIENHGSCQGIEEIPYSIQKLFVTAHDIAPTDHVTMQTTFQRHIDTAISKTINMPETATIEDVGRVYEQAWREGAKGITVYRNNCRPLQTLMTGVKKEKPTENPAESSGVISLKDLAKCPTCGAPTKHEDKCTSCSDPECGWSACSVA